MTTFTVNAFHKEHPPILALYARIPTLAFSSMFQCARQYQHINTRYVAGVFSPEAGLYDMTSPQCSEGGQLVLPRHFFTTPKCFIKAKSPKNIVKRKFWSFVKNKCKSMKIQTSSSQNYSNKNTSKGQFIN